MACASCTPKNKGVRILCCTFLILFILTIIVLVAIAIYLAVTFKMPEMSIAGAAPSEDQNFDVDFSSGASFMSKWNIDVVIKNANRFNIFITSAIVSAALRQVNNVELGYGERRNFNVGSQSTTRIVFPIVLKWAQNDDPEANVLVTLLKGCSGTGDDKIIVVYKIDVKVKVFGLGPYNVPTIEREVKADCPVRNQINDILNEAGITL